MEKYTVSKALVVIREVLYHPEKSDNDLLSEIIGIIGETEIAPPVITTQLHDLPAADSGLAKIETALSVYKLYKHRSLLYKHGIQPFDEWCQQQQTALAGK